MAKKRKTVDAGLEKTLQQYEQRFPDPQLSVAPLCQRVREAVASGDPALAAGVAILLGRAIEALNDVPVMLPEIRRQVNTRRVRAARKDAKREKARLKFKLLREQNPKRSKEDCYREVSTWLETRGMTAEPGTVKKYCKGMH